MLSKIRQIPLFILALIFTFSITLFSQQQKITFEHITVAEGLPDNSISNIIQDRLGFLWFTTSNGLVKYDGYSYTTYRPVADETGISNENILYAIFEDHLGDMWIATYKNGLLRFNRNNETFTHFTHNNDDASSLIHDRVNAIFEDKNGNIWAGSYAGLNKFNRETETFTYYEHSKEEPSGLSSNGIYSIFEDSHGVLWLGTDSGIYKFNRDSGKSIQYYSQPEHPQGMGDNKINIIYEDREGTVWFGTDYSLIKLYVLHPGYSNADIDSSATQFINYHFISHHGFIVKTLFEDKFGNFLIGTSGTGLIIFDREKETFEQHQNTAYNQVSGNRISSIFEDKNGILWIGTEENGLNKINRTVRNLSHYQHNSQDIRSISGNSVLSIYEDENGILWIGTARNGLNKFNKETEQFIHYSRIPNDDNSLSSNYVSAISEDNTSNLWIGTANGLNKLTPTKNRYTAPKFTRYLYDPDNTQSLSSNYVESVYKDKSGNLWIGTIPDSWLGRIPGGLNKFEPQTGSFIRYVQSDPFGPNFSNKNTIITILEDTNGMIWTGTTDAGLNKYDPKTSQFTHYYDEAAGLKAIRTIFEDSAERLWIGTYKGGLHLFDRESGKSIVFSKNNGLPDNSVNNITEDDDGFLWLGLDNGLSKFNYETRTFRNYDKTDGFNTRINTIFKGKDGFLNIGCEDGIYRFDPKEFTDDPLSPDLALTNFKIFNESVSVGENSPLKKHIHVADEIRLSYRENDISIEYAALHFSNPEKNQYAYRLENYEDEWRFVGSQRTATYTNLSSGTYIFRVKASNKDRIWNETGTQLRIIISTPPWRTWWAYILYLIIIVGLYILLRKYELNRIRLKHSFELKKTEAEKLMEIDRIKSRFFTNISHEFRTPLTLILGPLEKLDSGNTTRDPKTYYRIMKRHAMRLLRLINQLLDFSKIDAGKMKLEAAQQDIINFIKPIVVSFNSLAERKQINYTYHFSNRKINIYFDQDKLEKIVYNLLSNAFKFTYQQGQVEFSLTNSKNNNRVEMAVKDTGIGIPKHQIDHIFDRFYQGDTFNTMNVEGTGIGLALTKELVELHHGSISVVSEPDKGTTFHVFLPSGRKHLNDDKIIHDVSVSQPGAPFEKQIQHKTEKKPVKKESYQAESPLIMIVEDNADLRTYMIENISSSYRTQEAADGMEGFDKAIKSNPDLIISDVMMPRMDGVELCNKLKTDIRTSHIPIILLTAKATIEAKLKGLETGADDYITKPFNDKELEIRIKNLIDQRRRLRERFRHEIMIEPKEVTVTSADENFLEKAIDIIENNLSNTEYSVESFGKDVGLSRGHFYHKLNTLTGQSPSEFIRTFRLKRAAQLLLQNRYTIAEISFQVGFNEPSYFTKCFRNQFNLSPSKYISKHASTKIIK